MSEKHEHDYAESTSGALTRFSLDRRITVLVLFLSILVVGVVATRGIPLELLPRGFQAQSLQVYVPWVDSPTQEVLDKITLPLEEELSTVKGLDGINSFSRTGQSSVYMRFKQSADMDVAYREVRDRIERARLLFPDGVDRVFIRKEDVSGIPVAFVGLAIDPSLTDYYDLVQKEIVNAFERVDGVATVRANGLEEKEIIIEVDRELAEGAGLNIYQLAQELGDDNFTMASGNVRDAGKKFLLRSVATYPDLSALENRMITPDVRLKDIAQIRYEEAEKRYSVRVNSKPAVAIIILKEGEANAVDVSGRIEETFAELEKNPRLANIEMTLIFNQGDIIMESIDNLLDGGKIGGVFAALVLFFFLRRFRLTAIICLSIPLSMLIALTAMYFIGETLNILTILGLMVCVGLLVDNSVVVAENIHRLHRAGATLRRACVQGAGEIALAIVMATLTTVIVFVPVALIEGEGQFFLMRLALPITVSLLASLIVALVFVPLCVYLVLPHGLDQKRPGRFKRAHQALNDVLRWLYDATFGRLNHFYNGLLAFFMRRRLDMSLLLAAVFAFTIGFAFDKIEFVGTQEEDRTSFDIQVRMANEHNFDDTKAYFREAETVLEKKRDEHGLSGYFLFHNVRRGNFQGWLDDEKSGDLTAKEIAEDVLEALPKKPGVELFIGQQSQIEDEDGTETYVVRLQGEDAVELDRIAENIEPLFLGVDGVLGIKKGEDEAPSELALVVDRERATASGVNPQFIAGVISYAIRGSSLPRYNEGGRQIPVRVRFKEENRESLTELGTFAVPTASGEALPVSSLTEMELLDTPKGIFRRDKKITRYITLELKGETAKETKETLDALVARIDLPEGVGFGEGSQRQDDEEMKELLFALLLSIIFIYLLMGFLFESFWLPLSIILTIPLASIGVGWIHFIAGKDLDPLGMVGAVLLVGVVVNNGIVLIDYVNRLREEGMARAEALLTASDRRFRPIAMTALTTIIGMIPVAVSKPSSLGFSYKSFGLTLIGGMTTATVLTLLVVPVFYTLFDDVRERLSALIQRIFGKVFPGSAGRPASAEEGA